MPSIWRKTGGSWVKIKTVYRKTGGSWQSVKRVWRKSEGVWKLVFQQAITPSIQTKVEISTTGSQAKTLVGKLYFWSNATGVTYQFTKSTDGVTFSNISGASGTSTNPSSGGSNTLDQYALTQTNVAANTTNYYQYVSKATNSTFGTEQTSASDYLTIEAPRDLSLSATKTSTSITISWTNDTYSGRYEYQFKKTSDATWSTAEFIAPGTTTTSFTKSTLPNSTSYDFRVRGWTGTTNSGGYYGNWATKTESTNAPAAPNPPTNIIQDTILTGTDYIKFEWTAPVADATHDLATKYDWAVSTSNTTTPTTFTETTNTYGEKDGLTANTTYYVWVKAKNDGGSSTAAVSAGIKTDKLMPPKDITSLAFSTATQTSLTFTFTIPTSGVDNDVANEFLYSYNTTNTAPTGTTGDYSTGDGNTTSITIGGDLNPLTAGTKYYIFVRAKNNDGVSPNWVTANGTTTASSNPPTQATGLVVTDKSPSGFKFSWTPNGGAATTFRVAYSTSTTVPTVDGFEEGKWYDTASTAESYRFQGLTPNTTYYAFVKGTNADGTATAARSVAITTLAKPVVSNPTWNSNNFERTNYTQLTEFKQRARIGTTSNATITIFPNNSNNGTGTIPTTYSTANNTSVTLANLGAPYDGTRTVASVSGSPTTSFTATVASTTSQAKTTDADGTITGNTRLRWGFDDGTYTSSGSGTFAAITNEGVEYEIYDALTGGNLLKSAQFDYDFSLDSPAVNGTSYYHVFLSGRDGIDNFARPTYMRIRAYVTDYDGAYYYATFSGRL
jgi:hypothetical protein